MIPVGVLSWFFHGTGHINFKIDMEEQKVKNSHEIPRKEYKMVCPSRYRANIKL